MDKSKNNGFVGFLLSLLFGFALFLGLLLFNHWEDQEKSKVYDLSQMFVSSDGSLSHNYEEGNDQIAIGRRYPHYIIENTDGWFYDIGRELSKEEACFVSRDEFIRRHSYLRFSKDGR